MDEKRRAKRLPVDMELQISSLFNQDNIKVDLNNESIEVIDISKEGIGFLSSGILPIGFYFNTKICLGDSEAAIYCVVRIVRSQRVNDEITKYGCELIGFPPILNYIIDDYEKKYCQQLEKDS